MVTRLSASPASSQEWVGEFSYLCLTVAFYCAMGWLLHPTRRLPDVDNKAAAGDLEDDLFLSDLDSHNDPLDADATAGMSALLGPDQDSDEEEGRHQVGRLVWGGQAEVSGSGGTSS